MEKKIGKKEKKIQGYRKDDRDYQSEDKRNCSKDLENNRSLRKIMENWKNIYLKMNKVWKNVKISKKVYFGLSYKRN